jgi:hypothetical protein
MRMNRVNTNFSSHHSLTSTTPPPHPSIHEGRDLKSDKERKDRDRSHMPDTDIMIAGRVESELRESFV